MAVKIKLHLKRNITLCDREIRKVYNEGDVYHYRHFVIFYRKHNEKKCAVVASKKVGNSVCRSRAKRLLRELFRLNQYKLNFGHYVLVAKKSIINGKWQDLERDFLNFISKTSSPH